MELSDAQIERYSRQIILPAIGGRGQQRLLDTTVALIGDGAVAATAALYLTAAGIGRLALCAITSDGLDSVQSARRDLEALNPDTTVVAALLDTSDALAPAPTGARVFVCAEVPAAVLAQVNRAALRQPAPLVAGVAGAHPRVALYAGHQMGLPCAACDPEPPVCGSRATRADASTGIIGSLLALEAVKWCLGLPGGLSGRALHYDPETLTMTECPIGKRATCRACASA